LINLRVDGLTADSFGEKKNERFETAVAAGFAQLARRDSMMSGQTEAAGTEPQRGGSPSKVQSSASADRASRYASSRATSSEEPTVMVVWAEFRRTIDSLRSPQTAVDGNDERLAATRESGDSIT
jgi:hypothetical protein